MNEQTVFEVWNTDTYSLIGSYVGQERALDVASKMSDEYSMRVNVKNTGKTKQEYNKDKKGML